jgi:peroxiredoxin
MCNHCPYVVAVHERLSRLAREYKSQGIEMIGINSNDPAYREADSFENMKKIALEWGLPFPYVFDESQSVARAYDAVCTPDPYLYENTKEGFRLKYRGRIDDSWKDPSAVKEQSLKRAMDALLAGASVHGEIFPSMGCSIKWKELTPKKG